jgi:DNA modification methylase
MAVKKVNKGQLIPNQITEKLYGKFSNSNIQDYDLLKSIEKNGIQEPLIITSDFHVISGNRRLAAINQLKHITQVDVIIKNILKRDVTEMMIIEHQLQRVKDEIALAWEYEKLTQLLNIGRGRNNSREDLAIREKLLKNNRVSHKTINRVLSSKKTYINLHKCSEEVAWDYLRKQRRELGKEVNTIFEDLQREERKVKNKDTYKTLSNFRNDWIKIYAQDNENLKGIVEDNSIDCSISSPPYFGGVRKYLEDKKPKKKTKIPKGEEKTVEEYVESQMRSYREVIRTLKETGSIWINIADTYKDGRMHNVPFRLTLAMEEEGMIHKQTVIWIKNNPLYQDRGIYQPCQEYILHFVKDSDKYKWKADWIDEADEFLGKVTYGDSSKKRQFRNVMYYPTPTGGKLETNSHNSIPIKRLLESKGVKLEHSAMFPFEVSMICLLSTADRGDNILDNYHGMGTTAIVAYAYDCHYWGIEYSSEYANHSIIRIEDFIQNNPNMKPQSKEVTKLKKSVKTKK